MNVIKDQTGQTTSNARRYD